MTAQSSFDGLEFDLLDRLHKAMRYANLTSAELADRIGVHRNTVANHLSGRSPVTRRTLMAWAIATGVPLEWLETGKAPARPEPDGGMEWAHRGSNPEPAGSVYHLVAA